MEKQFYLGRNAQPSKLYLQSDLFREVEENLSVQQFESTIDMSIKHSNTAFPSVIKWKEETRPETNRAYNIILQ